MKNKMETRKKFGRICALVVVGMFMVMALSTSVSAPPPIDWSTGGNVAAPGDILGTLNHEDLRIFTDGTQKMVVTTDGCVGIGTPFLPFPESYLHVEPSWGTLGKTIFQAISPDDPLYMANDVAVIRAGPLPYMGTVLRVESVMVDSEDYALLNVSNNPFELQPTKLYVRGDGNVGIGTGNPTARLVIAEQHAVFVFDGSESISGYTTRFVMDNEALKIGHDSEWRDLHIETDSTARLAITWRGYVGIGTTAPRYILDVKARSEVGEATFHGTGLNDMTSDGTFTGSTPLDYKVEIDGTGIPDTFKWSDDGGSTWDETGVAITGSAQPLSYGVTVTFGATTGHTPGDYWTFSTTVANPFYVQNAAGTGILYVGNDGKVGIGTTSPSQALHVEGNARITGALYDSNNDAGTSGQILQTTGSEIDWVDPSSISDGDWIISDPDMYSGVSGNVGIGTTSPTRKLEVVSNVVADGIRIETSQDPSIYLKGDLTGTEWCIRYAESQTGTPFVISHKGVSSPFQIEPNTPTGTLRLDSTGNVGIGTTSPQNKLDVEGGVAIGATYSGSSSAPSNGLIVEGDVGIGTTSPKYQLQVKGHILLGDVTGAALMIYSDSTPGSQNGIDIYTNGYDDMIFRTVSDGTFTERIRVLGSTGNVGIGTTSPAEKLDVAGTVRMAGFKMPNGALSGRVLTCIDAATGEGIWQEPQIGISGSGTTNYIPKFTDATTLGNSVIYENGGNIGIGTTSPTSILDVNGNDIRIRQSQTPSSSSADGYTGEIAWDQNAIYVCTNGDGPGGGTDTWKRASISTW